MRPVPGECHVDGAIVAAGQRTRSRRCLGGPSRAVRSLLVEPLIVPCRGVAKASNDGMDSLRDERGAVGDGYAEPPVPRERPALCLADGRWRWDLNPRRGCPLTRFRGVRPRPLGDSTVGEPTGRAGHVVQRGRPGCHPRPDRPDPEPRPGRIPVERGRWGDRPWRAVHERSGCGRAPSAEGDRGNTIRGDRAAIRRRRSTPANWHDTP